MVAIQTTLNQKPMQTQIKEVNFNGQNFYCGIDMHKKNWTVTIDTDDCSLRTFNQDANLEGLVHHLKNNYPGGNFIVGYEAGYFGNWAQRQFETHGITCKVLHPADIPTTHKEKDQKRDPHDSRKIARALRTRESNTIWIPPISIEVDRQLLRTRKMLIKDKTRTKNRIKALLQIHGIKYPDTFNGKQSHWSRRFIQWLKEIKLPEESGTVALQSLVRNLLFIRGELLTILRQIRELTKSNRYVKIYQRLLKIPGIGMITAMVYLTEVGDISRFKNTDHFRSFIGIIPRSNSSGEKDYQGKLTNRSNSHLRTGLIEAAWTAVRTDPYYLHLYQHHKQRMKGNKALTRIARNLANQIYNVWKEEIH
jgi:transposase